MEDAALDHRAHATAEIEHGGTGATQGRDLIGVVGRAWDRPSGGAVGEALDDQPAQGGRQLGQSRLSSIVPRSDPFAPSSASTSESSTSASSRSSSAVRNTLRAAAG